MDRHSSISLHRFSPTSALSLPDKTRLVLQDLGLCLLTVVSQCPHDRMLPLLAPPGACLILVPLRCGSGSLLKGEDALVWLLRFTPAARGAGASTGPPPPSAPATPLLLPPGPRRIRVLLRSATSSSLPQMLFTRGDALPADCPAGARSGAPDASAATPAARTPATGPSTPVGLGCCVAAAAALLAGATGAAWATLPTLGVMARRPVRRCSGSAASLPPKMLMDCAPPAQRTQGSSSTAVSLSVSRQQEKATAL